MKNQYVAQYLFLLIIFVTGSIYAQAPTVTSFSPATVTQKSVVTITGTNLGAVTSVKFGTATAASFTLVNATTLTAVVGTGNSGAITVTNASGNGTSPSNITYVAPIATPASAAITRVISNWQGYWSSTAISNDVTKQPNTHHDLTGFTYNSVVYSTGVDNATLDTKIGRPNYVQADFRALPVNNITGNTGGSSYLAMGSLIDGTLSAATYTAPGVAGLHVRDVLIDGSKGLDLGTGVTNLSASAVLSFNVNSIVPEKIIDSEPDILITQIAQPSAVTDLYYFTDAAGNIVGNPISASQSSVTAVGTYRLDLFTLTTGTAYSTVVPSGSTEVNNVRDIRMIALKLSDFGITSATAGSITQFKCIPGGDSDTAFTAYNAGAFIIPAPVITAQPASQVVCIGTGNATFSVTATGSNLTYQWRKNGIDISGATASSYSVASTAANVAAYSVIVTNASGSVISATAYLNTIIAAQPAAAAVCQGTATTLSVVANGASLSYQWYSNTTASANGGTLLTGATSASYLPSVATAGTVYYYCVISNSGTACAAATTTPVAVTVYAPVNAGTISTGQAICYNTTATVSLSGYTGTIQWQKSSDNTNWADVTGATSATYTTPVLTATTYYRAVATSGTCGALTSGVSTITVNAASNAGTVSANQTICNNTTATVSISGYTGAIQWQQFSEGIWTNITGATAATYTTPALTDTTQYRAIVTNSACTSATGNAITVTVNAPLNAGTISANQTVCYGIAATVSVAGPSGSLQWQKSNDETTWTNISGATNAAYTTPVLTSTMHYRVIATNSNCGNAISEITSVFVNDVSTWTGQISTDWNTTGNWACNILPTLNTNVSIPSEAVNQPTVHGTTGYAKSLTLDADAKLTIQTGGTLKVADAVKVATGGELTVQNNGSLIQDNVAQNSGNITVIRNSNSLYRLDYTMWSSPVTGQNLQAFSPQTSAGRFYEYKYAYDPTLQANREQYATVDPAANSFAPGKGYLIRMPNTNEATGYSAGTTAITFTGTFTGEPNNGDINYTLSTEGNRYTAVGNPYPSPISVEDFFAQNAGKLDRNSGIYMWRKKNNSLVTSYATLTLAGYTANPSLGGGAEQADYYTSQNSEWLLSQGQGFIVRTAQEPTSTSLSFTNSMRRAAPLSGTQAFLRTGQNTMSRLWLNMVGNETDFSQAAVAYIDGATLDLDYGYDGAQVNDGGIAIYSLAANTNLAIQARPEFTDNDIVTLGYKATAAGQYTINLDHTDGIFATGQDIYLKDDVMGVTRNLTNHAYTFTTEEGTFTNRFTIVYSTSALGTDNPELTANNVMVYKEGTAINISTGTATMTGVSVYDIRGRKLYGKDAINSTRTTITDLQAQQQVLIVEIATDKGIVSKKIVF